MSEKQEEVLETQVEGQEQTEQPVEEPKPDTGASVAEDGTIKLDLGKLNKPKVKKIEGLSPADRADVDRVLGPMGVLDAYLLPPVL